MPTPPSSWPDPARADPGGVGVVLLIAGVALRKASPTALLVLSLGGIAVAAVASIRLWDWDGGPTVLAGSISTDRFGVVVRVVILGVAALGAVLGHHYFERSGEGRAEFYPLLLFATAGMTLFAVSADLIMAFLALEILSLSLYVLTGFSTRLGSIEGAMKYFLLGSFSSAFFLFGICDGLRCVGFHTLRAIAVRSRANRFGRTRRDRDGAPAVGVRSRCRRAVPHVDARRLPGSADRGDGFMSAGTKSRGVRRFIRVFNISFQPITLGLQPLVGSWRRSRSWLGASRDRTDGLKRLSRTRASATRVRAARPHGGGGGRDRRRPVLPRGLCGDGVSVVPPWSWWFGRGERHTSLSAYAGSRGGPRGGRPAHPFPALPLPGSPRRSASWQGGRVPSAPRPVLVPVLIGSWRASWRLRSTEGHRADVHCANRRWNPSGRIVFCRAWRSRCRRSWSWSSAVSRA